MLDVRTVFRLNIGEHHHVAHAPKLPNEFYSELSWVLPRVETPRESLSFFKHQPYHLHHDVYLVEAIITRGEEAPVPLSLATLCSRAMIVS